MVSYRIKIRVEENVMVRYVKTIDELVDLIDKEFSGTNAVCPICKNRIGTVNIPDIELGLPELNFMQFKYPGVFCTNGHCIISMEQDEKQQKKETAMTGSCRLHIDDLGLKIFEVMKLVKPNLDIDDSIPNTQLYWMFMNKKESLYTKEMPCDDAYDLMDRLQMLGARVKMFNR